MLTHTGFDYWYLLLPAGPRQKGKPVEAQVTEELTELAGRGWEPISHHTTQFGSAYFTLRKASA